MRPTLQFQTSMSINSVLAEQPVHFRRASRPMLRWLLHCTQRYAKDRKHWRRSDVGQQNTLMWLQNGWLVILRKFMVSKCRRNGRRGGCSFKASEQHRQQNSPKHWEGLNRRSYSFCYAETSWTASCYFVKNVFFIFLVQAISAVLSFFSSYPSFLKQAVNIS